MNRLLALLPLIVSGLRLKTPIQSLLQRGYFWLVILLFSSLHAHTQESGTALSLKFTTTQNLVLPDVSVSLFNQLDSSLVKLEIADSSGVALFEALQPGNYFFIAMAIGYTTYISEPFAISGDQPIVTFPLVSLTEEKSLDEATVVYKKPFIERYLDKIVLNVDNSIVSMGSSILDVLTRAPGITISNGNAIVLRGKQGVRIMIDGKPSPLAGEDLINYLKTIPSANVDKIEIITHPSAKYDAEGNAGIINIKFKKDQRQGFNGSVSLSAGQGVYFKPTAATNLNFRKKKVNLFASYSFAKPEGFTRFYINRKFFDSTHAVSSIFDQTSITKQPIQAHNMKVGVDLYASEKTIIGAVFAGNWSQTKRDGFTRAYITDASNQLRYTSETNNTLDENRFNGFGNINLKHTFDTTGKEITVDLDYGQLQSRSLQTFLSNYYDSINNPTYINALRTAQSGLITVLSFKADYVHPLKNNASFEAGLKSSFVKTDNDILLYIIINGVEAYDSTRSNHFIYSENINAGYLNYSKEYKKISFQLGLRAEQTRTEGDQVTSGELFERNYLYFFPSAFFNYNVSDNYTLSLAYSKRIDRPNYSQLNPLTFFADPYTYVVGDPKLKPVMTHSFDVSHTVKGKYIGSIGYTQSKESITDVIFQNDSTKISYQTPTNMRDYQQVYASVSVPFSVKKWLNSNLTVNAYWNKYESSLQGGELLNQNVSWDLNMSNSFVFGSNGWSAELNGYYQGPQAWGQFIIKDLAQITIGAQKVLKNKLTTFKLSVSDIFYTNRIAVLVTYQNQDFRTSRTWDSRVLTFSFVQRFGKNTVAQARRRNTGIEDVKQRTN
ncbi:MAG: TonB-dependent receptor [Bacteroidota bacterium]